MSQTHDLHRALLRPAIIHTLRAAGFHSTKPSVLDTLINITERHLLLLASTTAQHAWSSHNDPVPSLTDVRMALADCGVLVPLEGAGEEAWRERMRPPLRGVADVAVGGRVRVTAEKRKREEEDVRDVREFIHWFDSPQHREIKRIAGMVPDAGAGPTVGVGGGVVHAEDFLTTLKKKHGKAGDEGRLQGTVLGLSAADKEALLDGGSVQRIRDWKPKLEERSSNIQAASGNPKDEVDSEVPSEGEMADTSDQEIKIEGEAERVT